ncbi:MAG: formylmethanofuran dehydrogenase [Methylotenera sp.]|nr:formylmethanofuran dehydrogenase [Methylotenera sp.]
MNLSNTASTSSHHACPACGLLCDDLVVDPTSGLSPATPCKKAQRFFAAALVVSNSSPSLAGKACDLNTAVQAAADILSTSQQALFAGLGTEVQGMRALLSLAEKCQATLDHMHSEASVRNTLAMQNSGWQTTTLSEVKNRADLIVAIGTDIVSSHPRFFEKLVWNADSLFNKGKPSVVYLGVDKADTAALVVAADQARLPEILNALNALSQADSRLSKLDDTALIGGVPLASLKRILEKIQAAEYAVLVWSASQLDYPHAELTVQSITQWIAQLNESKRVAGLSLNAGDGDISINQTCTWLSGYPSRSRFLADHLSYDTQQFSSAQQLKSCDALLWVSTFNAHQPPAYAGPIIAIGHPNTQFERPPEVFIPVGVPGVDNTGTLFRMDGSIALPLKKCRDSHLPRLDHVIRQIEAALN